MERYNPSQWKRRRVGNNRTSRIVGEDRLSNLPDDIIIHILSFLPTEASIPTGALAKSWKSLWKEVRHLNFDDRLHKSNFSDNVINALLSYQNRVFESLTINVTKTCDSTELAIWLRISLMKNVSKLVLRQNQLGQPVRFPERSLQRTNSLKILKLMGHIVFDLPDDSVSLHCLKEMHLYHVTFVNEDSFQRLLGGCPKLQDLVLEIFLDSGIETLIINVPSQRLTLASRHCIEEKFLLKTPCLEYLNTKKLDGVDSLWLDDVSKLTEATISNHEEHIDENILSKMTSAERLALSAPLQHPMGVIFALLVSLEIDTKSDAWCVLLSHMLTCSPKLQFLKFNGGPYYRLAPTWIEPEHTARSLRSQLHTVVWDDYNWRGADDRDVATYILKNAATLRDATFTTVEPTEDTDMQQMQAMIAQLANVERASTASTYCSRRFRSWNVFLRAKMILTCQRLSFES